MELYESLPSQGPSSLKYPEDYCFYSLPAEQDLHYECSGKTLFKASDVHQSPHYQHLPEKKGKQSIQENRGEPVLKYGAEVSRVETFKRRGGVWQGRYGHFSPQSLAEQGLYCDEGNLVFGWCRCFDCDAGIHLYNHKDCDEVLREHVRLSPHCQHLLNTKGKQRIQDIIQEQHRRERILKYHTQQSREETFTRKGRSHRFSPQSLAEQGLYREGNSGGLCRCYDCDVGIHLYNHKDCDEVLREHVRQSPHCQHLLKTKGKQRIQDIQAENREAHIFKYGAKASRVETFTRQGGFWGDKYGHFPPQSLAEQGLYCDEGNSAFGRCHCYDCDVGIILDDHKDCDEVLREHIHQNPDCQHLLKTKGKQRIQDIQISIYQETIKKCINELEQREEKAQLLLLHYNTRDANRCVLPEKDPGIVVTVGPGKSGDIYRMPYADKILQAGDGRRNNPQYMKRGNGGGATGGGATGGGATGGGATGGGATGGGATGGGTTGGGATGGGGGTTGWPPSSSSKEKSSGQSDDGHSGEEFGGGGEGSRSAPPEHRNKGHQDFCVGANIKWKGSQSMEVFVLLGPYSYVARKATRMEPLRQTEDQELSISCQPNGKQSQRHWAINGDTFQNIPGSKISRGWTSKFQLNNSLHDSHKDDSFLIKVYTCNPEDHTRIDELAKLRIGIPEDNSSSSTRGPRITDDQATIQAMQAQIQDLQLQMAALYKQIDILQMRMSGNETRLSGTEARVDGWTNKFNTIPPTDDSQADFVIQ